jgi:serine/threonine-protein kinase HipA
MRNPLKKVRTVEFGLTAQPSLDAREIVDKQMKLAMSVGVNRHYAMRYIQGRHFIQTLERAGLPKEIAEEVLADISGKAESTLANLGGEIASARCEEIHASVEKGFLSRLRQI